MQPQGGKGEGATNTWRTHATHAQVPCVALRNFYSELLKDSQKIKKDLKKRIKAAQGSDSDDSE